MNMKVFLILIVLYYRNDVLSASVSSCSDWSNWSNCSKTCGIGVQSRNRTCDGTTMDSKTWCRNAGETDNSSHNFSSCTVHSDWSQWTTWPSCSVECGNSTKTRSRQCNSTEQAHGGSYWQCQNISKVKCIITQCPVNGGWSDWSSWSNCSVTCGNGTMTNSRECNSPIPKHGGNDCQGENVSTKSCEETLCPDSYSLKTNSDSREKFTIFSTLHLTTYASDSQIGLPTLTMNTHLTSLPLLSSGSEVKKKYMLSDTQMTSKTEDIGSEDTLYSYQVASDMFPSISISSSASHQTKTNSYDRHRESLSLFLTSTKVSDSYPLDAYSTYEIIKSEYLSSISAKPTCADVFHISSSISQAKKISASLTTDSLPLSPTSTKPLSYLLLPSENRETFLDMGIVTTMSTKKLSMTQESISSGPMFPATKTPSSLLGQIPNNIHEPSDTTAHWQGTSIRKDTYVYNISPTQTMQGNTILDNSVYSSKMETSRSIERTNALTTPHTESSTGSEDTTYKNNTTSDVPMYKWLLIGSLGILLPVCSIIGTLIYCCARYNVSSTDKDSDIKKPCHMSETWYDNALFNDKTGQMPQHYDHQYRKGIITTQIIKGLGQTYDHRLDIVNNDSNTKSGSHSSTETVDLQRSSSTKARKQESMLIPNYQIKKISTANISKKVVSIKRNSEVLDPTNLDRSQQPHLMVPRQYKHTRAQKVETYLYEEESGVLVPYGYMESNVPIPDYEDTSVVPLPDYQIGIYCDKD